MTTPSDPFELCRGCYAPWPECGDLCSECAGLLRDDLVEDDAKDDAKDDA